ncbi:MAG TPA: TonB-dependent receptor plug domain-containing protein, partial [Chitinophagaceae bacterium]|nr:TonB-dependent receptor plug domain-containing protein [Chitinophagaceae bacterium]
MRTKLLCVVAITMAILFSIPVFAQRQITGTVTDEKQVPLPRATVSVKGTKVATVTDASGKFTLTLPANAKTLVVSFIGMQQQEVAVGEGNILTVTLLPSSSTMSDVVVIGYGTRRRAEITSSISSVSAKELRDLPVAGIDQAIQGKIAGVTVTNNSGQPGGGVSVRVRGITSVNNNEPLYVIDGVPISATDANSIAFNMLGGGGGQTGNSVLASLNPNDIESIDVLKDASAQAIYGSQAANGVIIINTKRGKTGEGKFNYD